MSVVLSWLFFYLKLSEVDLKNDERKVNDEEPDKSSPADASLLQKIIRKGLIESKQDVEVQRKDPNSPLYSVKSFEALTL